MKRILAFTLLILMLFPLVSCKEQESCDDIAIFVVRNLISSPGSDSEFINVALKTTNKIHPQSETLQTAEDRLKLANKYKEMYGLDYSNGIKVTKTEEITEKIRISGVSGRLYGRILTLDINGVEIFAKVIILKNSKGFGAYSVEFYK